MNSTAAINFHNNFDGLASRTIFCIWSGNEIMSENRLMALWTLFRNAGCPIAFITRETVSQWIKPEYPLHPAYEYLSSTHKADYLRCYLMHHYGGGYTDIKQTHANWHPFFEALEQQPAKLALGYHEIANGIPHVSGEEGNRIRQAHHELIGLCAFIFRRNSSLTQEWLARTEQLLDQKLEALKQHPAQHPLDQTGVILPDGNASLYPLRWAEMLGEIFHPLIYRERAALTHAAIEPIFAGYR